MNLFYKTISLFFLGGMAFSITADAGNDQVLYTEHNGDVDANLTFFENILDGSASLGGENIDSWNWEQISGPDVIQIINVSDSLASFSSSAEYDGEDKIFEFELTILNIEVDEISGAETVVDDDSDIVIITIKPEENLPPVVEFQGLSEGNSIDCGGSVEGSENGFSCTLFSLNQYIAQVSDPEGDDIINIGEEWYNESGQSISDLGTEIIFSNSEPHYLIYRAIDSYGDYQDAVITIYSSVQNTYPEVSMLETLYYVNEYEDINNNGEWNQGIDEESLIQIQALISDNEHLISDLDINWDLSCSNNNCNESESFEDSNGNGIWDEGENFEDCGLDNLCSNDIDCLLPDIDGSEDNGEYDQAVFLDFESQGYDQASGTVFINFKPPEVRYNSDNIQFVITLTVRDPFQQYDSSVPPSISSTTLVINNINRAPSIESHSFEDAQEDQEFSIDFENFEICDFDNEVDEISLILFNGENYDIVSQNQNIIIPTTESLSETSISVEFLFNDGEDINNTANYSAPINVQPFNDIPEVIGLASGHDFFEDQPFTLTTDNLEIYDPDNEFWDLTVYENENSSYSLTGNNNISPYENYNGEIIIPLDVTDGNSDSEIYNLSINLIPVNDPPTSIWEEQGVSNFNLFIDEDFGDSILFNFNTIFSDVDNEELIFNYPDSGDFNLFNIELANSDDLILYSLSNVYSELTENDFLEKESFEIFVTDGESPSNMYDFEVTVLPKNDSPIFSPGSKYVDMAIINGEQTSVSFDLTSTESINEGHESPYVFDIENNPWNFEIVDCPDNGYLVIGEAFDDFGLDGCDDVYEDGAGGCLENPNFGPDGCDDLYEDGEGGCLEEINSIYISADPNQDNFDYNGDNYDFFNNISGRENNCKWDEGEDFIDDNFSQSWDAFDTYFEYYPNPGFRCVDQIKIKAIDQGIDYFEEEGVVFEEDSYQESNIAIIEVFVDLCNFPPEIDSYNQESITSIQLIEDETLNMNDVDLNFFNFLDEEGNDIIALHAIIWNDFGEDGIEGTNDSGEGNNEWDYGEGWSDCGLDGICFDDSDYPGPDTNEGDGQLNENIIDNIRYSVISECSNPDYVSQNDCEYNQNSWETTVVFQENYNGSLNVAVQANDGQTAYNLSIPHIVEFYIQPVNDSPIITNAYIISDNDTINYVYEDNPSHDGSSSPIEFKIEFEDIDSESDLNDVPFNLEDLDWDFSSSVIDVQWTWDNRFYIESLQENWNGVDSLDITVCDDLNRYCDEYEFIVKVLPVNDFPNLFSPTYSSLEFDDSKMFEDGLDFDETEGKTIEYAISYNDVDCDAALNNFHFDPNDQTIDPIAFDPEIFIPDSLIWESDYQGINIEGFELLDFISMDSNCNEDIKYYKKIQFSTLRENWNGFDSIPIHISSPESEDTLSTIYLPVEVFPLNDDPENFNIDAELYDYAMDETTFYTPCEFDLDPECTETIHGYPFSNEDNFFRLHNVLDQFGDVDIASSVDYTNFDVGKILFKWDRTSDVDLDSSISEYYQPELYYRIELVETGEFDDLNNNNQYDEGEPCEDINMNDICDPPGEFKFVLKEIDDSLFSQESPCSSILGDNNLCSNDDFSFMNDNQYGWATIDVREPFFKYKDGFFDNPDLDSGEQGFYTSVDSTMIDYGYDYIDYFGTTEYKWRVIAYNRWWDYYSNNENEVVAESDDMRFFIDLERPYADFSIIQNPLYPELYELYMLTNEAVFIEGSKLYINQIPRNLESFADEDNPEHSTFFYYVAEFGEEGNYEYDLYILDCLKNGGIADYSISYLHALPGIFSNISSPTEIAQLIIPEYSLLEPSGIIISEKDIFYEDLSKISVSSGIDISTSNLNLQSPMKLRFFINNLSDFENNNLKIGKKNNFGDWEVLQSDISVDFIEAEISDSGLYTLFYIEEPESSIPSDFELIGCYPNPFNPNINIDFSIPYETMVKVDIYDINGKKIRTLVHNKLEAGFINLDWDGINDDGDLISSGIYFVMLKMDNQRIINKITMLK